MNQSNIFRTVDALAGAGKTFRAIRWALREAAVDQRKTVFVFKSIELIHQAFADMSALKSQKRLSVPITKIHSSDLAGKQMVGSVGKSIIDHLEQTSQSHGEILMITEVAFLDLQHWPKRYLWTCICDEIPEIVPSIKKNLPENHHLLTQHIQLIPAGDKYSEIGFSVGGKAALKRIAENKSGDEVNAVLQSMAKRIINPIYQNFVLTSQFNGVLNQTGEQLELFSLLQPSVFGTGSTRVISTDCGDAEIKDSFANVIIMGAGFGRSLMAKIWLGLDVRFEPHEEISENLRYTEHTCGPRLTINFVFERDWSKSFGDNLSEINGAAVSNFDVLKLACNLVFQERAFVYLVNKDRELETHDAFNPNAEKLPNSPWGLNSYQTIHNAAILAALNPTNAHLGFLDHLCQDSDAVRDALFHSQTYQAVMRSSLRDLSCNEPVQVVVPDRKSAIALAGFFPDCKFEKLDMGLQETKLKQLGRPALDEPKDPKLSQRETRQRRRALDKQIKKVMAGEPVDQAKLEQFQRECKQNNQHLIRLLQVIEENR